MMLNAGDRDDKTSSGEYTGVVSDATYDVAGKPQELATVLSSGTEERNRRRENQKKKKEMEENEENESKDDKGSGGK